MDTDFADLFDVSVVDSKGWKVDWTAKRDLMALKRSIPVIMMLKICTPLPAIQSMNPFMGMLLPGAVATSHAFFSFSAALGSAVVDEDARWRAWSKRLVCGGVT